VRKLLGAFLAVLALVSAVPSGMPSAHADACPDVDVTYARGTDEPPGIGRIGQRFVDALRADARGKSVGVYAVNYPAIKDWGTTNQGVADGGGHLRYMAANCPNTRLVLAGFSQGASVMTLISDDWLPPFFAPPFGAQGPLPPSVANHVVAVVLFGLPSTVYLNSVGAPPIAPGPLYLSKVINMCLPDDPVCSIGGRNDAAHRAYADNNMPAQAAWTVAGRLG